MNPRAVPLLIREAATPWEVLVAEVMSQQTGIERVGPAWRRFIERWPAPADLAEAGTHDLLAAWAGLGYNRRALALREAARSIVADHDGRVPDTVEALERLPGIGPYTARAIAAAAFGVPVAPLDVNVRRVVSRVLGVPPTMARATGGRGRPGVSRGQPGRWLDAVMDLATDDVHCLARRAATMCPLGTLCASRGTAVPVEADTPAACPSPPRRAGSGGDSSRPSRSEPSGTWVPLPDRLGDHDADAIGAAARVSSARASSTSAPARPACGRESARRRRPHPIPAHVRPLVDRQPPGGLMNTAEVIDGAG